MACLPAGDVSDVDRLPVELPRRPLAVVADGNAKLNHYAKCGRALTEVIRQILLDCGPLETQGHGA